MSRLEIAKKTSSPKGKERLPESRQVKSSKYFEYFSSKKTTEAQFAHYKSMEVFLDAQGCLLSKLTKLKHIQDNIMHFLAIFEKDQINSNG